MRRLSTRSTANPVARSLPPPRPPPRKDSAQHRTNEFTDQRRTNKLTDQRRTSELTDQRRTNKLTDQRRTSELTDQRRTNEFTDQRRTSEFTDQRRTSELTDQRVPVLGVKVTYTISGVASVALASQARSAIDGIRGGHLQQFQAVLVAKMGEEPGITAPSDLALVGAAVEGVLAVRSPSASPTQQQPAAGAAEDSTFDGKQPGQQAVGAVAGSTLLYVLIIAVGLVVVVVVAAVVSVVVVGKYGGNSRRLGQQSRGYPAHSLKASGVGSGSLKGTHTDAGVHTRAASAGLKGAHTGAARVGQPATRQYCSTVDYLGQRPLKFGPAQLGYIRTAAGMQQQGGAGMQQQGAVGMHQQVVAGMQQQGVAGMNQQGVAGMQQQGVASMHQQVVAGMHQQGVAGMARIREQVFDGGRMRQPVFDGPGMADNSRRVKYAGPAPIALSMPRSMPRSLPRPLRPLLPLLPPLPIGRTLQVPSWPPKPPATHATPPMPPATPPQTTFEGWMTASRTPLPLATRQWSTPTPPTRMRAYPPAGVDMASNLVPPNTPSVRLDDDRRFVLVHHSQLVHAGSSPRQGQDATAGGWC
jgi:hypothetical protein